MKTMVKSKRIRFNWIILPLVGLGAFIFSCAVTTVIRPNDEAAISRSAWVNPAPQLPYPPAMYRLTLQGTWSEMGLTYGQQLGQHIAVVSERVLGHWLEMAGGPDVAAQAFAHLKLDLAKTAWSIKAFAPEMIEFMDGLAQGAAEHLNLVRPDSGLSNLEKIQVINVAGWLTQNPGWHSAHDRTGQKFAPKFKTAVQPEQGVAFAAFGRSTPSGGTIAGISWDQLFDPYMYQVAIQVKPSDQNAAPYQGTVTVGCVSGNSLLSQRGLWIGQTRVGSHLGSGQKGQVTSFGVNRLIAAAHVAAYAQNKKEAAEMLTYGTPGYTAMTGYKTLIMDEPANYLIADELSALVVERTAESFAVRYPGVLDEKGDYIICAGSFSMPYGYDVLGNKSTNPMTTFGPNPDADPANRYRSNAVNLGLARPKILVTGTRAKEIVSIDYIMESQRIMAKTVEDPATGQKIPVTELGYTMSNQVKDKAGQVFYGTVTGQVIDPTRRVIEYTLGPPSLWMGPWDRLNIS
ncbi:MAG: hypothetical protein HQK58_00505 [Deltaproteobacteria bacterium]|nr:hypothetical protein [Deltaproteobacteria bacterium]